MHPITRRLTGFPMAAGAVLLTIACGCSDTAQSSRPSVPPAAKVRFNTYRDDWVRLWIAPGATISEVSAHLTANNVSHSVRRVGHPHLDSVAGVGTLVVDNSPFVYKFGDRGYKPEEDVNLFEMVIDSAKLKRTIVHPAYVNIPPYEYLTAHGWEHLYIYNQNDGSLDAFRIADLPEMTTAQLRTGGKPLLNFFQMTDNRKYLGVLYARSWKNLYGFLGAEYVSRQPVASMPENMRYLTQE